VKTTKERVTFITKISCLHKTCRESIVEEYGICRTEVYCTKCGKLISKDILCDECNGSGELDHLDEIDRLTKYPCTKCNGTGWIDYEKAMTPIMPPLKY
jgi:DnaJ-class molecular chaperone